MNNGALNLNGIGVIKNNSINQMYFNPPPAQNINPNFMNMPYANQNQYQMMYNGQSQLNFQQPYSNQAIYQQQLLQANNQFQQQNQMLLPNIYSNQIPNQFLNNQDQRIFDAGINTNFSSSGDTQYQNKIQGSSQFLKEQSTKNLNNTLQMQNSQLSFTSEQQNFQSFQLLNQNNNSLQHQFQGNQQFANQIYPQQIVPQVMYSNYMNQPYPQQNINDPYRSNFLQSPNPINFDQTNSQNNQHIMLQQNPIENNVSQQQEVKQDLSKDSKDLNCQKQANKAGNKQSEQIKVEIEEEKKRSQSDQFVKNLESSENIEVRNQTDKKESKDQDYKHLNIEETKDKFEIEESMISLEIESFRQSEISTFQNFNKEIIRTTSNKTVNVKAPKQKKQKKNVQESIMKTPEKVDQSMISQNTTRKFDINQQKMIDEGCSFITEHQVGVQHMQLYIDKLIFHINQNNQDENSKKNVIELLSCYDELYSEVTEGQVVVRRNPLSMKFELLTFIDISNIFKEKKQKAIKVLNQLTKLNHPHLLSYSEENKPYQLLDQKKSQNSIILVKQEAPDHLQNWKSFCKRPFNTMQILSIIRQLCLALSYIHDQGIIIRDIHPSRIHQINKIVKLNIIGLPKNFKKLLKNDTYCGHVNYSAPEMLNDQNETLTEKVDIWALGCCIYYLSSKKNPFDSETPEKIKWNIRNLRVDSNMYMAQQQQQIQNQSYPSLILNNQNLSKIYSGQRDQILDDLIWMCLKENHTHRPRATQLLQEIDRLEIAYYGRQMLSYNITKQLIESNQSIHENWYVQKYEKNPNQTKNNPEFFSKKVGDKLMKILTVEETLDLNQIIKKKQLSEQEQLNLINEFSNAFQLQTKKQYSDNSEIYIQSRNEEVFVEDSSQFDYFSGSQNQNKSDSQRNSATIKNSRNDTQDDILKSQQCESPILQKRKLKDQIKNSKGDESMKAQSIGKSSTQTSQQMKKIIEEQLYDLISDKSKIANNMAKSQFNSSKKRKDILKQSSKQQNEKQVYAQDFKKKDDEQEDIKIEQDQSVKGSAEIQQIQQKRQQLQKTLSFEDQMEVHQTPFFQLKVNQSTPKDESPQESSHFQGLAKFQQTKINDIQNNNVLNEETKNDNNIQYFQLKTEKIQSQNIQTLQNQKKQSNDDNNIVNKDTIIVKKDNEIVPSPQILKEQFNKLNVNQKKDGNTSSKSSSSSQNKKSKTLKKVRNHTPINQLSKFAKDHLLQEVDDDLMTEAPSRKAQSKEQKFKFKFSNQREQEELQQNVQNRKQLIQNLYENRLKINGIETNLSKEQIIKNEKMYERRMSIALDQNQRLKNKVIEDFESQYQNLMKIRSNSIQMQFDQIEKVKQILEKDAKQLNYQQIASYNIGSQNKIIEEFQDFQTVQNDQKSSQKDQQISKSSQSPMSTLLQKLTNSHQAENFKEQIEQNKISQQTQEFENQNIQGREEDLIKKQQKQKDQNLRSLSKFSNPQQLNAKRFNQFQSEIDSSSDDFDHPQQKKSVSSDSSKHNCQLQDDMLSQFSIDSNIKQILRGPYGIQNNSTKNRKFESSQKQDSESGKKPQEASKFQQRSKSRKPLNSQQALNKIVQQIDFGKQVQADKNSEKGKMSNQNNDNSDESVESKKILQQYKNYAPPQLKRSHVRVSYKDSIKLNHQRSFSQSSVDKSKKKENLQAQKSLQKSAKKVKNLDKIIEEDLRKEEMQSSQEDNTPKSAHFFDESNNLQLNQAIGQNSFSQILQNLKEKETYAATKNELIQKEEIIQNDQEINNQKNINQFFDTESNLSTIHNVEHQVKPYQLNKDSGDVQQTQEKKDSVFGNYIINRDQSIISTQYNQSVQSFSFNGSNFIKSKVSKNKFKDSKSSFFKDNSIVDLKNLNPSSGKNSSSLNESFDQVSQSVKSKFSKQSSEKSLKKVNGIKINNNPRGRSGFYQIQQSEQKLLESVQRQNNTIPDFKLSQSFEHLQASLKSQMNNDQIKQDFIVEDIIKLNTTSSIYSKGTFGISNHAKQQLQFECMSVTRSSADNSAFSYQVHAPDLSKENQIVTYNDGSKFIGQIVKQGKGTFYSSDGSIYIGTWVDDKKNGHGKIKFPNEDTYEGNWENDMINGQGVYTYNSGDIYKGHFLNGLKDGFGIMEFSNNEKYEGYWKQDNFMGDKGEYSFANGNRYKGQFLNGKFEGKGELILPNEGKYTGNFKQGSINGHGKFEYNDGSFYEGEWKDCLMQGQGKLYQAKDSTIFEGSFLEGKKNGIGILTKENESKIKGLWKNDELEKIIIYENLQALDELLNQTKQ